MSSKNYYEILQVSINSSNEEIKSAYRKMALKYHPDMNRDNQDEALVKFKEIQKAYDVLSDQNKRKNYDSYGGPDGQAGGFNFGGNPFDSFNDFFSDIFSMSGSRKNNKGKDKLLKVSITLEEAFYGKEIVIAFESDSICLTCKGKGAVKVRVCNYCDGAGVTISRDGFFSIQATCQGCNGLGQVAEENCSNCNGKGVNVSPSELKVQIPAGIQDGSRIKLLGKGHVSFNGGSNGDLFVIVNVVEHHLFSCDGCDLYCEYELCAIDAILGKDIEINSIDNSSIKFNIPAGSQYDDEFVFKNKGMYKLNSSFRGNMYITLKIVIPKNLNESSIKIFKEIRKIIS